MFCRPHIINKSHIVYFRKEEIQEGEEAAALHKQKRKLCLSLSARNRKRMNVSTRKKGERTFQYPK